MVHQCVSEDFWLRTMLDITVRASPVPDPETQPLRPSGIIMALPGFPERIICLTEETMHPRLRQDLSRSLLAVGLSLRLQR